jgi:hypothetical protein
MAEARGDTATAREQFLEASHLLRKVGEMRWLILSLAHLGGTYLPDFGRAERVYLEALELAETSGDIRGAAIVKGNLGSALIAKGEDRRAAQLIEEALAGHRALSDDYGMAGCLASLATLALRRGDLDVGAAQIRESIQLSSSIGDTLTLSTTLAIAAAFVLERGDAPTAARLCAADAALLDEHGFEPDPELGETTAAARDSLGDRFDDTWESGTRLDLDAAVELALTALGSRASER